MNTQVPAQAEQSLQDDFLEASNKEYHRQVTKFQLQQAEKMKAASQEVLTWKNKQLQSDLKKCYDSSAHLNFIAEEHLQKTRAILIDEADNFIIGMQKLLIERNEAITSFCRSHE